jgi:hypothetical protein
VAVAAVPQHYYYYYYLFTAIGFAPGGSGPYTTQLQQKNIQYQQQKTYIKAKSNEVSNPSDRQAVEACIHLFMKYIFISLMAYRDKYRRNEVRYFLSLVSCE